MRKLIKYPALAVCITPFVSHALGLGDMRVRSYLNQPLHLEIQLVDVGNLPSSGIQAKVASVEDFNRAGLERVLSLDLLTFKIKKKAGRTFLDIRSTEPVTDPYLDLLIDLAWSKGQVYRAYTVLLDPPSYEIDGMVEQSKSLSQTLSSSRSYQQPAGLRTLQKCIIAVFLFSSKLFC